MKKKIKIILIIAISIVLVTIIMYRQFIMKINIKENTIGQIAYEDINNDGNKEKIQISSKKSNEKNLENNSGINELFNTVYSKEEINICINDNNYRFMTNQGENAVSWAIADLNNDKKLEILVCVYDNSISPSYRKWNIYTYNDNNLKFVKKIYDGYLIEFNRITNRLHIKYSLHETRKPMRESVYYDVNF